MASLEQVEILLVNRVHWVKDGEEAQSNAAMSSSP